MAPTNDVGDASAAAGGNGHLATVVENGVSKPPVMNGSSGVDNNNTAVTMNGTQSNHVLVPANTPEGTDASVQAALQRSLDLLSNIDAESGIEEIKKLDSQIDHFNNYLDKFEAKNNELNKKLNELLETQKEERLKRRASFQQREAENKEQNDSLRDQMQTLLNRCQMARRSTVADVSYHAENDNSGMETMD